MTPSEAVRICQFLESVWPIAPRTKGRDEACYHVLRDFACSEIFDALDAIAKEHPDDPPSFYAIANLCRDRRAIEASQAVAGREVAPGVVYYKHANGRIYVKATSSGRLAVRDFWTKAAADGAAAKEARSRHRRSLPKGVERAGDLVTRRGLPHGDNENS